MDVRRQLVLETLSLLERGGEAAFSTRAVCMAVGVTAPTLYHHFGTADGLLGAAIEEGFAQFLIRKKAAPVSEDPIKTLVAGWDSYVGFAAERPRLYATLFSRVLAGADIPAAAQARAMLLARVAELPIVKSGQQDKEQAADLAWASAHAAAMLYVTARAAPPSPFVIEALRRAMLAELGADHA